MGKKQLTALTDLEAEEVSLVDRGANKKKPFPIVKREQMDEEMKEILAAVLETEIDEESKIEDIFKASLSEKGAHAVKGAMRILSAFKEELPEDLMSKLSELAGFKKPEDKACKETAKKEEKEVEDVKKEDEKTEEVETVEVPEEITKKLETQAERIEKAEQENAGLKEKVAKMQDDNSLRAWVTKAEAELSHYPGKSTAELGEMLHKMEKVDAEVSKEQFETMKKASDALKESELLKEVGTSVSVGGGNAWDTIEKKAAELVEKSEGMDKARAIDHVLKTSPELYAEYLKESEGQA
jgi:phage-related protein